MAVPLTVIGEVVKIFPLVGLLMLTTGGVVSNDAVVKLYMLDQVPYQ